MKTFMKIFIRCVLVIQNLALIPLVPCLHEMSERMLANESTCIWTILGGKCLTCGGTHFVNSLTGGHIWEAFLYNPYLFFLMLYFGASWVFLNLWIFGVPFGKKALKKLYNIPMMIILVSVTVIFLAIRTIPTVIALVELIQYYI